MYKTVEELQIILLVTIFLVKLFSVDKGLEAGLRLQVKFINDSIMPQVDVRWLTPDLIRLRCNPSFLKMMSLNKHCVFSKAN